MTESNPHPWDVASFDWPTLRPESLVLEIGAYKGRWAKEICSRYAPCLYAFEPAKWAYDICKAELAEYPRVRVFNFALGTVNEVLPMGEYETDGCSFLKATRAQGVGVMRKAETVFERLKIAKVDLALINIEGYEYVLVPHLIQTGLINRIERLMIQLHDFAADLQTHDGLLAKLNKTHRVLWDYGPTLMAWEKR